MRNIARIELKILTVTIVTIIQFTLSGCSLLELLGVQKQEADSNANAKPGKVINAVADTYVMSNAKEKNFGKAKTLKIKDGNKNMESLIRFSIPSSVGKISSAKLKIMVTKASGSFNVYKTNNNWNENNVTWSNRPGSSGGKIATVNNPSKGWYEIDVSSVVKGTGQVSFILFSNSSGMCKFKSKETSSPPKLLLVANGGDPDDPDDPDDNDNNNTGNGKFTVTSVNDDLDNSDGQDFLNGFKGLGNTLNKWDKNVSTTGLKGYLETSQEMVYHTGHGSDGIIMTSNGSLGSNNLTVQSKYFIIATCLTLKVTSWKNVFGSNTKTIMGYTKVSFDKPVDNNLVSKYISNLKAGNSHVVSWYKSNAAISDLKDRWCAYSKEGSKVVEYSARTNNTPKRIFSGDPITLYGKVTVNSSLLNSSTRFDRAYQAVAIDEISSPLTIKSDRNTWPSTPTSLSLDEARNIAQNELTTRGGLPTSGRLERVIPIERCDESECDTVAYQAYYVRQYNGYDLTSHIGTDYISVLIDDMGVSSMDIEWSQVTPLDPGEETFSVIDVGTALNIAGQSISQLIRGNAVNIVSYENVYGVQTDDEGDKFLVPAYQFITDTGEQFSVNAITGQLVY